MTTLVTDAATDVTGLTPRRRVRHDARDALAVIAFSAAASTALALGLTLLVTLVTSVG